MKGPKMIDLTGKTFGKLFVIEYIGKISGANKWLCRCECGSLKAISGHSLRAGTTISCGCERKKRATASNTKHGQANTRLYQVWHKMKQRCDNPNVKQYKNYGGRGISYCAEWGEFSVFYEWAKTKYKPGLTIERVDVDKNYSPDNCRFATNTEQQNNRRNNHFITYKGQKKTIAEWSIISGIDRRTIASRIDTRGWDPIKAITTPIDKRCLKHAK